MSPNTDNASPNQVMLAMFLVLNFDAKADEFYIQILLQNPPLKKKRLRQDLRIAAIAFSQDATVITCNHRNFGQVPGL